MVVEPGGATTLARDIPLSQVFGRTVGHGRYDIQASVTTAPEMLAVDAGTMELP